MPALQRPPRSGGRPLPALHAAPGARTVEAPRGREPGRTAGRGDPASLSRDRNLQGSVGALGPDLQAGPAPRRGRADRASAGRTGPGLVRRPGAGPGGGVGDRSRPDGGGPAPGTRPESARAAGARPGGGAGARGVPKRLQTGALSWSAARAFAQGATGDDGGGGAPGQRRPRPGREAPHPHRRRAHHRFDPDRLCPGGDRVGGAAGRRRGPGPHAVAGRRCRGSKACDRFRARLFCSTAFRDPASPDTAWRDRPGPGRGEQGR